MAEPLPICTVGHSTRSIPEFVELLRAGEVQLGGCAQRPALADQPAM